MLNAVPMVTTKKITIENTQKEIRKGSKCVTTKKSQLNKKGSNGGTDKKAIKHTKNK